MRNAGVTRYREASERVMIFEKNGIVVIQGDVTSVDTWLLVEELLSGSKAQFVSADPPYFDIVKEQWDSLDFFDRSSSVDLETQAINWFVGWTLLWAELLEDSCPFYTFGSKGRLFGLSEKSPVFRPFLAYPAAVERASNRSLNLANFITWDKKRAIGTDSNYLTTAEYLAYFLKGFKPKRFNVPLLETERGYEGYNAKYPAKSKFYRRKDTFTDIFSETEILRGKSHVCEKPAKLCDILINIHCEPGDIVIDLFAGSASLSKAARRAGCTAIAIESSNEEFNKICEAI